MTVSSTGRCDAILKEVEVRNCSYQLGYIPNFALRESAGTTHLWDSMESGVFSFDSFYHRLLSVTIESTLPSKHRFD